LIAYGNELDDTRRALLFEFGDIMATYAEKRTNGNASSATDLRALCRAVASGSRLSGGFLSNLFRVATAFPPALREAHADQPWGWFLECVRERDPLAAADRYAGMSIGQIKDLRKTRGIAREPGYVRLQVTLRPDQVSDLEAGRAVIVERALIPGVNVKVTVERNAQEVAKISMSS
jgi:hypothetical protein